jgi:tungstate transport system substrate-binding protein
VFEKLITRLLSMALLAATAIAMPTVAQETSILVQSTTSTQNTGLYEYLLPRFTAKTGIGVNVVAVGTGQAIKNAMNGDGDVLLVHDKPAEEKFVAEGYGVERFDLMYNDFIVVGPANDPAGVAAMQDTKAALKKLAGKQSLFASRGDNSGTHSKELALWKAAGVNPAAASGTWYRETGSGMGATLNTAVGMGAYALTDRGTWISFKNKGGYKIVIEGDPELFNQYGVVLVNPRRFPNVKAKPGQAFVDWLISDEGQAAIAGFKIEGQQLFFPNAKK